MKKKKIIQRVLAIMIGMFMLLTDISSYVVMATVQPKVQEQQEIEGAAETEKVDAADAADAADTADTAVLQPELTIPQIEEKAEPVQEQLLQQIYWNAGTINEVQTGATAETAVQDLETAIQMAKEIYAKTKTEVPILVEQPLKVEKDTVLSIEGEGIVFQPTAENTEEKGWMFQVAGGELQLANVKIFSGTLGKRAALAAQKGNLVIGKKVVIDGSIWIDYQNQEIKSAPTIQVAEVIETGVQYLLDLEVTDPFYKMNLVHATYAEGETGEALLNHFVLCEEAAKGQYQLALHSEENIQTSLCLDQVKKEVQSKEMVESNSEIQPQSIGSAVIYWNVESAATSPEGDRPAIAGGSDGNDGTTPEAPVLTWKHAKTQLGVNGGTIVIMNPIAVGVEENFKEEDGSFITTLDGNSNIRLQQWTASPTELFLLAPSKELTLKNIQIDGMGTLIRITEHADQPNETLGKLIIDVNTTMIGSGFIQTELNPQAKGKLASPTVEVKTTDIIGKTYPLYYSGITDNQVFDYADVVKLPEGADASTYLPCFTLDTKNQEVGWNLRKDIQEDEDGKIIGNHIELYRVFQYTGVYVNGVKGDDTWFGGNCNWPVKTYAKAKEVLMDNWSVIAPENRNIYICDTMTVTGTETWDMMDGVTDRHTEAKVKVCPTRTGDSLLHTTSPETLVKVAEGASFTTENIEITDDLSMEHSIVKVEAGGSYICKEGTILSGKKDTNYMGYGDGVIVTGATGKTTTLTLSGGVIEGHCQGVRVSGDADFVMSGGRICNNQREASMGGREGGGVSIASSSSFTMTGGVIELNRGREGGGVRVNRGKVVRMSGGTIRKNRAYDNGGGVSVLDATFNMEGTAEISENELSNNWGRSTNGGGVSIEDGTMNMSGGTINKNRTTGSGGGIGTWKWRSTSTLTITGGSIVENQASFGSGISVAGNTMAKMSAGSIRGNSADSGGGVFNQGTFQLEGGLIAQNKADYGAGLYSANTQDGGEMTLLGGSVSENIANQQGGGIYVDSKTSTYLLGTAIVENKAAKGGSVSSTGNCYFLKGIYRAAAGENDGNQYGIYLDVSSSGNKKNYIDPEAVSMPDKVYLSTAQSKLYLINTVPKETSKLPLYLDTKAFSVGSLVVEPARISSLTTGGTTYTYPNIATVAEYAPYFTGGVIPPKTQLDGVDENIILIGEGVYLDGSKGSDTADGSRPRTAVKTFAHAKELLGGKIAEAKVNGAKAITDPTYDADGFEPYIYICGEVRPSAGEETGVWELDYDADVYNQRNLTNTQGEVLNSTITQIKRFGNYPGIMVNLTGGTGDAASLHMGKLLMSGNGIGAAGLNKVIGTMIKQTTGTTLTLEGTQIQDSYSTGVSNQGGNVNMGKDALIKDCGDDAVYLEGGRMVMNQNARIATAVNRSSGRLPGVKSGTGGVGIIGDGAKLTMNATSSIEAIDRYGIRLYGRTTVSLEPSLLMQDTTKIENSLCGIGIEGKNSIVELGNHAQLWHNQNGVEINPTVDSSFTMKENSQIVGQSRTLTGIYFKGAAGKDNAGTEKHMKVELQDDTKIIECGSAMAGSGNNAQTTVSLSGNAAIEGTIIALNFPDIASSLTREGLPTFELNLTDQARIGGLHDNTTGNVLGISVSGGVQVNLSGDAAIQHNTDEGIRMRRAQPASEWQRRNGISMSGNSKISHNGKEGILCEDSYDNPPRLLDCRIKMTEQAKITENTGRGILLTKGASLTMTGKSAVTGNASVEKGAAIYALGKVSMEGSVTVDKEIYLDTKDNPLTMTSSVTNTFQIGCSDNFVGQILIQPDGKNLTQMDDYVEKFQKTVNFPKEKEILLKTPNLVIKGENDVYWAGPYSSGGLAGPEGDDVNNGTGVGAPVATFARAKELLKEREPGANIIICNYPIVINDTQTFSFEEGSTITNKEGITWTTKVLLGTNMLYPQMFQVVTKNSKKGKLTLENIILDGNKEQLQTAKHWGIIEASISTDTEVHLKQGTVIQNAGARHPDHPELGQTRFGGIISSSGILTMTGVILRNNEPRYAIWSNGTTKISGGVIEGNQMYTQTEGGRLIYQAGGTLELSGGLIIRNNTLTGKSGDVSDGRGMLYIQNATAMLKDVEIYDNTMESNAKAMGGVFVASGTCTIAGANIHDNTLSGAGGAEGGGVFMGGGTLNIISGTIEDNHADKGAGIYYAGGTVRLSGGLIRNNTPKDPAISPRGEAAGIYVNGWNVYTDKFILRGGGASIADYIYVHNIKVPLTLGGSIYQKNRSYKIDLKQDGKDTVTYPDFKQGNTVVAPDDDVIRDTSGYLRYFTVEAPGFVLERESPNLILKQSIFIDSEKGLDSNVGNNPDAAVATMARAIEIGGKGNYIVYASGPIYVEQAESWSVPSNAWISRYTGFPITGSASTGPAYQGSLITVRNGGNLTIAAARIQGRRTMDAAIEADSLLRIEAGSTATLEAGAELTLNKNASTKPGGAVYVDKQGILKVQGGSISATEADKGGAVYQDGTMQLANESSIAGEVYLAGEGAQEDTSAYIQSDSSYKAKLGSVLQLNMQNPYEGRKVIAYPDGSIPGEVEKGYYQLNGSVLAMFTLKNRNIAENILELQQKGLIYINGVSGDDGAGGGTPGKAVKTLQKAYELLKARGKGGVILVVDTITVANDISLQNIFDTEGNHGYYKSEGTTIDAAGAVYIRRYAQPSAWESLLNKEEYRVPSHTGVLLEVAASGKLTMDNIAVEGHSHAVVGEPTYAAEGIQAQAPLIHIKKDGTLIALRGTTFYQNINQAVDAKSAAVWIDQGKMDAKGIIIKDVEAPKGKGSAIYQDGTFILSSGPEIHGSIHLTGNQTKSSTIEIGLRGFRPVGGHLTVTMDDAKLRRPVIQYPGASGNDLAYKPTLQDISIYLLEKEVTELYSLGSRLGMDNMLELQYKHPIYIDGVNGWDGNTGNLPNQAVKTLKAAYTRLKQLGGGYLYVVNTVKIADNILLESTRYQAEKDTAAIEIIGGNVEIRRYVVPDAKKSDTAFSRPGTHTGALFSIAGGSLSSLSNIVVDGHREPMAVGDEYTDVAAPTEAQEALIRVEPGAVLNLNAGVVIKNNNNTNPKRAQAGGAIYNQGVLNIENAQFAKNQAVKGSGIYQDGSCTIVEGGKYLAGQQIYLSSVNAGTENAPVWTSNNVIHIQERFDQALRLEIEADNPVNGRDIAVYDNTAAYHTTVDAEYFHYTLGTSITSQNPELYLVESTTETDTLELYNYQVLDISVPPEVFLVMVKTPENSIMGNPHARNERLEAPTYTITNGGNYETKVSIVDFKNVNTSASIPFDQMTLVDNETGLTAPNLDTKLYLALAPADAVDNQFAGIAITALCKITPSTPLLLGTLGTRGTPSAAGTTRNGSFTFTGQADASFFTKYKDLGFNSAAADPKVHIKDQARAKYQMVYKFEMIR